MIVAGIAATVAMSPTTATATPQVCVQRAARVCRGRRAPATPPGVHRAAMAYRRLRRPQSSHRDPSMWAPSLATPRVPSVLTAVRSHAPARRRWAPRVCALPCRAWVSSPPLKRVNVQRPRSRHGSLPAAGRSSSETVRLPRMTQHRLAVLPRPTLWSAKRSAPRLCKPRSRRTPGVARQPSLPAKLRVPRRCKRLSVKLRVPRRCKRLSVKLRVPRRCKRPSPKLRVPRRCRRLSAKLRVPRRCKRRSRRVPRRPRRQHPPAPRRHRARGVDLIGTKQGRRAGLRAARRPACFSVAQRDADDARRAQRVVTLTMLAV